MGCFRSAKTDGRSSRLFLLSLIGRQESETLRMPHEDLPKPALVPPTVNLLRGDELPEAQRSVSAAKTKRVCERSSRLRSVKRL